MSSLLHFIRITLNVFAVLFVLQVTALAQSTSSSSTTTPSSQATGSGEVLHPTQGEIIPYGSPYTIRWTPPNISGKISIELWDDDQSDWANEFTADDLIPCDGWLANSRCGKIAITAPNTGEYVWNVPSPLLLETLSGNFTYYMGVYIQQASYSVLPTENSPWYARSGIFTIAAMSNSSTSDGASSSTRSSTGNSELSPLSSPTALASSTSTSTQTSPSTAVSSSAGVRLTVELVTWKVLGLVSTSAIWWNAPLLR